MKNMPSYECDGCHQWVSNTDPADPTGHNPGCTTVKGLIERNEARELLKSLAAMCPSSEGLGGHAPIEAFITLGYSARAFLAKTTKS